MKNIHIGTSGWSYKGWKDIFYPTDCKAADYLSFYARHYDVTEINSSFYRLPSAKTVNQWLEKVPEGFLFCPKISRYLSHLKKLNDPEEPLKRFFDIFGPMKKQMGPVLIQLPKNVAFNESRETRFYEILTHQYPEFTFALEVRDESWYSEASLNLMRQHNISSVIAHSDQFPYLEAVTSKNIYLRFHGPNELYASSYSDKSLEEYAQKFRDWDSEGHIVWAFFNNDINGYALDNSKKLKNLLDI